MNKIQIAITILLMITTSGFSFEGSGTGNNGSGLCRGFGNILVHFQAVGVSTTIFTDEFVNNCISELSNELESSKNTSEKRNVQLIIDAYKSNGLINQ